MNCLRRGSTLWVAYENPRVTRSVVASSAAASLLLGFQSFIHTSYWMTTFMSKYDCWTKSKPAMISVLGLVKVDACLNPPQRSLLTAMATGILVMGCLGVIGYVHYRDILHRCSDRRCQRRALQTFQFQDRINHNVARLRTQLLSTGCLGDLNEQLANYRAAQWEDALDGNAYQ